jgi:lysophospholipase L1-like esterase
MRVDVLPAENVPTGRKLLDYSFGENAWKYLDMMRDLCEENDIQLVLIKAPSLYPYWYEEWDEQVAAYAQENGLPYLNFLKLQDETGIDYSTDTYDAGLHMNLSGAEKLADYIGKILSEEYQVPDRRGEEELEQIWKEKIEFYEADKQAQYQELSKKTEGD